MDTSLESIIKKENKNRITWGFIIAFLCAVLWGFAYVAFTMQWIVPPFGDMSAFPEGAMGMMVATATMLTVQIALTVIILSIFYLGGTGKFGDFPRTVSNIKISKWYAFAAVLGGPIAIYGTTLAIGYIGAAFAASAALLSSVIGAFVAKLWYGENITKRAWTGIAIMVVGGVFILNPPQTIAEITNPAAPDGLWLGYLGAIASFIGWGIEGAIAGRVIDLTDSDTGLQTRFFSELAIWLVIIWPIYILLIGPNAVFTALSAAIGSPSFLIWTSIAVLTGNFSYVFMWKSYPLIGVGRGMSVSTLYVLFAIIALYVFMGIPTAWWVVLGALIAVVGIFVMYWDSGESLMESTRSSAE
ncbi:MAG: EamA-like transporter family protein [Methanomethylovorans sp. PtaU1.Bin093]|jgi:drug/metabolite transporter (DMT)-like permease|uniref:EamA family transporter n=1 Tax=Methanomethylovorans sp. PtaU1.Bin093 TaxID=1811679 RepID=UPI0009C82A45|nr:EamA family transporter [Methanomethylovorans sp. PtaU1.Bin093]OPY19619.1 MAG: EamA-like transporter family protein [Methanomethylovorans sp. PtaU1.Bin093]